MSNDNLPKGEVEQLIARLRELAMFHISPYNLGDGGEISTIISKLYAATPAGMDAVAFAEWCNERYEYDSIVKNWIDSNNNCYETSELYAIYSGQPAPRSDGGWISVEDRLPVCPENKQYENVQCGHYNDKGKFVQHIGFYAEKHKVPYEDLDGEDGEYDPVEDAHGTLYLKPGWYEFVETQGGDYDYVYCRRTVTHWRPLQQPPQSLGIDISKT